MDPSSIREAVFYYTGGAFRPSENSQWDDLQAWILKHDRTPWEFCYFIVHVHSTNRQGSLALKYLSWLKGDAVRQEFLAWTDRIELEAQCVYAAQILRLKMLKDTGINMVSVLLDPREELSSLIRVEFALQTLDNSEEVCKAHREVAEYILRGCPSYRKLCPRAAEYLEGGTP